VGSDTEKVIIVSEGVHDQAGEDVPRLLEELGEAISKLWGGAEKRAVLSAAEPRLEFGL
jgi:hypothetical protein